MRWYVRTLCGLGGGLVGLGLWMGLTGRKLYVNVTVSLPPGLYVCQSVEAAQPLRRGQIVKLLPPETIREAYTRLAPQEPQTAYWMKKVVGLAGDTVCLHGNDVTVQGEVMAHRPLLRGPTAPVHGCWRLGPEDVMVLGTHRRSWDARYTGPWHRDTIHGTCEPLYTWEVTQ